MGKVNSKDYQYLFQYEQQRDFLLSLIKNRFDEFRDAVVSNDELAYTFRRITHQSEGVFFSSKHAAIGYFKEDVFYNKKRTKRVFMIVTEYYRGYIKGLSSSLKVSQTTPMRSAKSSHAQRLSEINIRKRNFI